LVEEKQEYVQAVNILIANGIYCHQTCSTIDVPNNYYTYIKKIITNMDALEQSNSFVQYKINGAAQKIHPGHREICLSFRMTCLITSSKSRRQGKDQYGVTRSMLLAPIAQEQTITIKASGKMLPTMLVFMGASNGQIA
jgi:hypothetical protein